MQLGSPEMYGEIFAAFPQESQEPPPEEEVPAPNHEPSGMEKSLQAGEIPEVLAETMRLVPFDSKEGQVFHRSMLEFAKKLYSRPLPRQPSKKDRLMHHDFEKDPVRFMLSEKPNANAFNLRSSKPAVIVFTKKIFETLITSPDRLALILCHEMTHAKTDVSSNSKLEEGSADVIGISMAAENGLDAEAVLPLLKDMEHTGEGVRTLQLSDIIDEHPLTSTRRSIAEVTLSALRKERGDLKPKTPSAPFSKDEPWIQAIQNSRHESFVQKNLPANFETLPLVQKLQALQAIKKNLEPAYEVRVRDMAQLIKKLPVRPKTQEEWHLVHALADDFHSIPSLYYALSQWVAPSLDIFPMGRLLPLQQAARNFVKACEEDDEEKRHKALHAAAVGLLEMLAQEPLLKNDAGKRFLENLRWPSFEPPNAEVMEAMFEDSFDSEEEHDAHEVDFDEDSGNGGKAKRQRGKKKYGVVSWQPVFQAAKRDPAVLEAALAMGLSEDLRFQKLLIAAPDLGLRFHITRDIPLLVRKISDDDIAAIKIDRRGRMAGMRAEEKTQKKALLLKYSALQAYVAQHFADATNDPHLKQTLAKLIDILETMQLEHGFDITQEERALYGLEGCETHFDFFLEANYGLLIANLSAASRLLQKFKDLLKRNPEAGKACIKEFFTLPDVYLSSLLIDSWSKGFGYTKPDDSPHEDEEGEDGKKLNYLTSLDFWKLNPYTRFLEANAFSTFTDQEIVDWVQRLFCHKTIEDAPVRILSYVENPEEAERLLRFLQPWLEKTGRGNWILKQPSFPELVRLRDESKNSALFELCFMAQAALLLHRGKNMDVAAALDMLEFLSQEDDRSLGEISIVNEEIAFRKLLHARIQRNIQAFAASLAKSENLQEAIRHWSILKQEQFLTLEKGYETLQTLLERVAKRSPEERINIVETLMKTDRLDEPNIREQAIRMWVDAVKASCGRDDGSPEMQEKMKGILTNMKESVPRMIQPEILARLATAVESQRELTFLLEENLPVLSGNEAKKTPIYGILADYSLKTLREQPKIRKKLLEYLTAPYTESSRDAFVDEAEDLFVQVTEDLKIPAEEIGEELWEEKRKKKRHEKDIRKSNMQYRAKLLYENFWLLPMEVRAVATRELLLGENDAEMLSYAVEKTFPKEGAYAERIRAFVSAYVQALPPYQQALALAAMMVAAKKTGQRDKHLGELLALFAENMGPAETKMAQAAESHPNVPEEISRDIRRLKCHAEEPMRWEIFRQLDAMEPALLASYSNSVPSEQKPALRRVGRVLGSASLFVGVEVEMSDGSNHVLAMLRPHAKNRAQTGFQTMLKTIDQLQQQDEAFGGALQELLEQAEHRLDIETACPLAPLQYGRAQDIYAGMEAVVEGQSFSFRAPAVTAAGKDFYMMEKLEGDHALEILGNSKTPAEEKRRLAMAILAAEFKNIMNGRFDSDRHGGNIKISGRQIGHFDFKGLSLAEWGEEEYGQLNDMLARVMAQEFSSATDVSKAFHAEQKALKAAGVPIRPLVMEVQKALLSLGEYIRVLSMDDVRKIIFGESVEVRRRPPS